MNRRNFLRKGSLASPPLTTLTASAFDNHSPATANPSTAKDFPLLETTIDELQQKMQSGEYSSESITKLYLKRIAAIDKKGPALNAVVELNPDALDIARAMDAERKLGNV